MRSYASKPGELKKVNMGGGEGLEIKKARGKKSKEKRKKGWGK